ncbi:hypothetical protein [Halorarum halobium]|uniref:hypothetical protein n=1 Tax=Halorarum halobium TaxID=3075121 RepID=UPI0028AB06F6|nr:hypothetical protein [Halobaculum sp. XH14]
MTDASESGRGQHVDRTIRGGILLVFLLGVRRGNPNTAINAVGSLAGSYLPALVEGECGVELRPWQRAYVETAMLTHAVGMAGPYDDVWWWDHLTHTHSATVLGGIVHAVASRRGREPGPRVLAVVFVGGLVWELAEYAIHLVADRLGLEPLLVFYGRRDTLLDVCFNLLGALLVIAFGDRLLGNLAPSGE